MSLVPILLTLAFAESALAGPNDPESAEAAFARIADPLATAATRLEAGDTGEETRSAQQAAVAEMARLIEAVKRQPPAPSSEGADQGGRPQQKPAKASPSGEPNAGTATGGTGDGGAAGTNREGKAEESSERRNGGPGASIVVPYRNSLIEGTWGHLPPRLREQLLNGGNDRVLPKYDPLVRRYFESLAEPDAP